MFSLAVLNGKLLTCISKPAAMCQAMSETYNVNYSWIKHKNKIAHGSGESKGQLEKERRSVR